MGSRYPPKAEQFGPPTTITDSANLDHLPHDQPPGGPGGGAAQVGDDGSRPLTDQPDARGWSNPLAAPQRARLGKNVDVPHELDRVPSQGGDAPRDYHGVMVSSTFRDLQAHRAALAEAIGRHNMHPVSMEQDTALPAGTVVDASLTKVRDASAYVGIISHCYGHVPATELNPDRLSLTELEFQEARRLDRPILIFIMGENHPVRIADIEQDPEKIAKLVAFREEVKRVSQGSNLHRVYHEFNELHEFHLAVTQAVGELRRYLDQRQARHPYPLPRRRSAYWRQVERIAPPRLLGREAQLAELSAFCLSADDGPQIEARENAHPPAAVNAYRWWQAPAWAGKSALMATFVLHPPPQLQGLVQIVSFFITARLGDTQGAFTNALIPQLTDLLNEDPLPPWDDTDRETQLLDLLDRAAACLHAGWQATGPCGGRTRRGSQCHHWPACAQHRRTTPGVPASGNARHRHG